MMGSASVGAEASAFPSPVPSSGWLKRNDNRRRSYYLTIWTNNLQLLRHLVRFGTPAFRTHVGMPLVKTPKEAEGSLNLAVKAQGDTQNASYRNDTISRPK